MSWNDPCLECGNPRYSCECPYMPPSEDYIKKYKEQQEINEEICKEKGHDWHYTFIVYSCKRCGETTDY